MVNRKHSCKISCWAFIFLWLALLTAFVWTPFDVSEQSFRLQRLQFPGLPHLLGIDGLGRDFFSRVWLGSAWSLLLGALIMAGTLGLAAGLLLVTERFQRISNLVLEIVLPMGIVFPVILIALLLLALFPPSPALLVVAVILGNTVLAFRQLRILWQTQSQREYVVASVALGASRKRVICHTILPNLSADLLALVRLFWAIGVLELSGLAFIGLAGDPDFPELGAMIRQNQPYIWQEPAFVMIPGGCLFLLLLSIQLFARRS